MNAIVDEALGRWGLAGAAYALVAARENAVFRVEAPGGTLALRLHRQGYRSDGELASELAWMAAVSAGGLSVPAPIPARSGAMLEIVAGTQVDALAWLDGEVLSDALEGLHAPERAQVFRALGEAMARLHEICDAWSPGDDFERCHWDRAGLLGAAPLWGRFWENPELTHAERRLCDAFKAAAAAALTAHHGALDYGLIHADLVPGNVLLDGQRLHLIDFDDGGYGYRLFDIATALHKLETAPDFDALKANLLAGYTAKRALDLTLLDLFFALRAATYVGWNITRMDEPGGTARNRRFIDAFTRAATRYLSC